MNITPSSINLPEGYSIYTGPDGRLQPRLNGVPIDFMQTGLGSNILHETWYMEKDLKEAVSACWRDFSKKMTEEYNEKASFINVIWGYYVGRPAYVHPECLTKEYNLMAPVTYGSNQNSILDFYCQECHEPLVSYEEQEELFYYSDNYQPDHEGEIAEKLEQYALKHGSVSQIDGYRAGLQAYPESRDMKPEQYARWIGYQGEELRLWLAGYNDAQKEGE